MQLAGNRHLPIANSDPIGNEYLLRSGWLCMQAKMLGCLLQCPRLSVIEIKGIHQPFTLGFTCRLDSECNFVCVCASVQNEMKNLRSFKASSFSARLSTHLEMASALLTISHRVTSYMPYPKVSFCITASQDIKTIGNIFSTLLASSENSCSCYG